MKAAIFTLAFALLSSSAALADWRLNNDESKLNFVSTKKSAIAEINQFKSLTGVVNESGEFSVNVDLNSVETNIAIRNQRMRKFLFETASYPWATISGQLDIAKINALTAGQSITLSQQFTLSLHGKTQGLNSVLKISKLKDGQVLVSSFEPVIINANVFDLNAGIAKLKELAGLPSISAAIPVTFNLTFDK